MNDHAPAPKKRNWLAIILGVLLLFGMLAVGCVVVTVSFFRQNFDISDNITEAGAKSEFDAVYARFPGQQPFIEMRDGRPQRVAADVKPPASGKPLTTLHVIAFDPDDEELAKVSLPFWLLRMKSGPIKLSAYSDGWDDRGLSFNIKDLEDHGPGIIVDVNRFDDDQGRRREGRLLIWAE
jgi:hypothetical protein